MRTDASAPAKVLLACSGLEHAQRGFESFAREAFDRLRYDPRLDMRLVKATGPADGQERSVPALKRDGRLVGLLSAIKGDPLKWEQYAFGFILQPEILRWRPEVVYFSEWFTGVALDHLRRFNRQDYALVLSNGSMWWTGFEPFDRVHQHTQPALDFVLEHGGDPRRHILLPVAFEVPSGVPSAEDRAALRDRLGLPRDRPVVISVAALNRWHKRLDHLVTEVARIPEPRPFVLLVGQPEPETEGLRELAQRLLGEDGHSIRTVTRAEVDDLLDASDFFVLASLAEGLPRALVEGMAHGLRCVAHDYPVAHYALDGHGLLCDMTEAGALAALLERHAARHDDPERARERQRSVRDRFSWDVLAPRYVEMLHGAVGRRPFDQP